MSKKRVEAKPDWWDDEMAAAVGEVLPRGAWPDKAIAILAYCWPLGISAKAIAEKIEKVTGARKTAGAIRGKANRLEIEREWQK